LKAIYRAMLPPLARRPGWAVVLLIAAFAGTGWAVFRLGEEFLPDFQENGVLMHWIEKPGTSLEVMRRITVNVSKELRTVPEVRNFGSHIGRAEVADEVVGPNFTELWISVDPEADHAPTLKKIEKIVAGYPGIYQDVLTYLKERIKEVLTGATVVVRIFGPDMDVLRAKAQEIATVMEPIQGVTILKVEQ
jgi:Cu/Ag efflux pump CusA